MTLLYILSFVISTFVSFSFASSEVILDPLQHDIQILTAPNFESLLSKYRKSGATSVFFYNGDDKASVNELLGWYNDAARELKGMAKVAAINCKEFKQFCSKIGSIGKIVIYPVLPIPKFEFNGEKTLRGLKSQLLRFIPRDNVSLIGVPNQESPKVIKIEDFLTKHISVPKVLVFSEKEIPPTIIHSLANEFNKKLLFGFIPNCKKNDVSIGITKKFQISSFPTIMVYKTASKPHEFYRGEIKFLPLFEFLNVYAETFVMGGGFSDSESQDSGSKPWLLQRIPELTGPSYNDVCGKYKNLCFIYLKKGEISLEELSMLEELQDLFTPNIAGRGISFKWMWMDASIEDEFMKLFNDDGNKITLPSAVVLGTNKRLKFAVLPRNIEGDLQSANKETIKDFLDKVIGGDARFTNIKGQRLPKFVDRTQKTNKKSEKSRDEL
ncbi:PDI like thioredoxin domain containing [Cryptosporidium sp. chipmunk genotype I]|uniref:PDI like thioredoxin domain containing n=1 Tax=Cryptosporidium sp. chipmunk genotype I TaxID=1280935 RepID=UPI00351A8269|nr:PDI like thioredoxin domain containing [Cryptosporidium sp. chipmunk genotype I]